MSEITTKERIMIVVGELLKEGCPVAEITVRKIAQRAGVGIGTVSYHFHSKGKLVYEVIAAQMADLARELTPGGSGETAFERLKCFIYHTSEQALDYNEIFRAQTAYEVVNGDMNFCYYITPLLKEHFGGSKSDLEIKLIALQMISALQMILLKTEEFQHYSGVNIQDRKQREEVLDAILSMAVR